jgi:hypothetical protein
MAGLEIHARDFTPFTFSPARGVPGLLDLLHTALMTRNRRHYHGDFFLSGILNNVDFYGDPSLAEYQLVIEFPKTKRI